MDRKLIEMITNIVPSGVLRKKLYSGDYDEAMDHISDLMDSIDDFSGDMFGIFDYFYWAIEDNDSVAIKIGFEKIGRLYFLEKIFYLIAYYCDEKEFPDDELLKSRLDLNWYNVFLRANIDEITKKLLALKDKKYAKVDHIDEVFSMPYEEVNENNTKCLFIEGILSAQDIGFEDVANAILQDDPDGLMEKIKVIAYLREKYMELKEPEINLLKQAVEAATRLELKRKK